MWLAGLLLLSFFVLTGKDGKGKASIGETFRNNAAEACAKQVQQTFLPIFAFAEEEQGGVGQLVMDTQICQLLPLYGFLNGMQGRDTQVEDRLTIDMILLAEGSGEGSGALDGSGEDSDDLAADGGAQGENTAGGGNSGNAAGDNSSSGGNGASLEELLLAENEAAGATEGNNSRERTEFVPHTRQVQLDMESLKDYETLVKTFYTIDGTTMIGSDQLNTISLGSKDMTVSKDSPGPQILIYHTHSQEAFADSTPGDSSTGIVGVGEYLTQLLTTKYGYQVLHHTGEYDVETRDDAYSRSLPAIQQVLADNPSIQVVIDLHRDAMAEETHLVMDLDGRPTARFMFFNGLSRTKKTGNISYLYNENLEDNLAFSYQMQVKAAEYYPGLTRRIYLKGYRYNMHLRPKTLLIELGAQNNTLEEALNACDPLAHILDMVLSGS